jgi:chitinase
VTGPASTTAGVSAPYGNGTSTYVPSSTGSLVDPTFTSAPYSNGTIPAGSPSSTIAPVVTTPAASLTTSTLTTTTVYTITSCPATVPNCPVGSVTTETITLGVTVCPVVDVTATVVPVTTTPAAGGSGSGSGSGEWTTSTVYTTKVYTITACPPSVPNCPGKGSVTTEIVPAYTTVCPVTATGGSSPSMPAGGAPGGGIKQEASPTTTTRVTSVAYTFITVSSKGPSAGLPAPSGNGSSSVVVSYTVKPTGSGGVAVSSTATGSVPPKPTKPVTAGASRAAGALGLAGLFAAGAMLL